MRVSLSKQREASWILVTSSFNKGNLSFLLEILEECVKEMRMKVNMEVKEEVQMEVELDPITTITFWLILILSMQPYCPLFI